MPVQTRCQACRRGEEAVDSDSNKLQWASSPLCDNFHANASVYHREKTMHLLSVRKSGLIALVAGALVAYAQAQVLPQPAEQPAAVPGGPRGGRAPIDPRVEQRTYTFKDTNE